MAIGTPVLRSAKSAVAVSITSDAFTPNSNSTLFVVTGCRIGTGTSAHAVTITDSAGLTWTTVQEKVASNGSNPTARIALHTAVAPLSPSSMTVTTGQDEAARIFQHVYGITGGNPTITNSNSGANNSGDPTVSITAPSAGSLVGAAAFFNGTDNPPDGLATQLAETFATDSTLQSSYTQSSGPSSVSWTTANIRSAAILYELKVALTTGAMAATVVAPVFAASSAHGTVAAMAATVLPVFQAAATVYFVGSLSASVSPAFSATAAHGIGPATMLVAVPDLQPSILVQFTDPPDPGTITTIVWSRCDRCGMRVKPDELVREADTGLYVHPSCLDDRIARRPIYRTAKFRNPRPDTEFMQDN